MRCRQAFGELGLRCEAGKYDRTREKPRSGLQGFRRVLVDGLLQDHALRRCCRCAAQCLAHASDVSPAAAQLVSDLAVALAILAQLADDFPILVLVAANPGAASNAALRPGTLQASNNALTQQTYLRSCPIVLEAGQPTRRDKCSTRPTR